MATNRQPPATEHRVKLGKTVDKNWHIMRFKPPHKCELDQLVNPTLDRRARKEHVAHPEEGEGSEFGKKRRDEVRKKKRGFDVSKAPNPDDQPWVLKEKKRGGKHFVGRKEGTVNSSSSYYILTLSEDSAFEAYPIKSWYDFVPPIKYNFLNEEEAEEQFEKRNKTLNYFSVMVSKRLRDQEGEGERAGPSGPDPASKKRSKGSSGLMLTDSGSDSYSSDASDDVRSKPRKKGGGKKRGAEGEEETDEGEMESWEVDYMSDSSSDEEPQQKGKEAAQDKEDPAAQELADIDKGFSESSSEDELTEEGKELSALIKKQSGNPGSDEEDVIDVESTDTKSESPSKSSQKEAAPPSLKREREKQTEETKASPTPPPTKRSKKEFPPNSITEEEVKYYLMRKPITSKDLVRKFTSKKVNMDKKKIVDQLHQVIQGLRNVEQQTILGKLYLSIKSSE